MSTISLSAQELQQVRSQFPALVAADTPDSATSGYIFAENAGGSQVLSSVAASISSYLLSTNVQMSSYPLAQAAESRVSLGTCAAAALLGADSPDDVMIGQSATALVAAIAAMIEHRGVWGEGGEVVISDADHETNRGAWSRLAQRLGMGIKHWPVTPISSKGSEYEVTLDPQTLHTLVTPQTKLVAFTACSNLLGAFTDIKASVDIVRSIAPDAIIAVDCVAYAPHRRITPRAWGVDIAFFSVYKTYGAHVGAMYVSPRVQETHLARLNHFFLQPQAGAQIKGMYPFQTSSVQYELNHSIAAVADYLVGLGLGKLEQGVKFDWNALFGRPASTAEGQRVGMSLAQVDSALDTAFAKIAAHESTLLSSLIPSLLANRFHGVRIVGPESTDSNTRAPTVAFILVDPATGKPKADTSKKVHSALVGGGQVGAQQGHMYAHKLVQSLGLDLADGVVRLSFVHYNTADEVQRVVALLERVLRSVL
ncbi:hypothetical protein EX895_005954 [Sporisorium graminicola]|uniref:Aminotransferase class V domain-containing protein n=1 Tax=Sporisorium graminicola TaxID=280036 RepID=A0A4U7KLE0_9BASI|nr:hypothetical protein EX895_005954 [Sporisorium graminicola]TKY84874.1 hypothetical protein EX895_005954 [Sporisorium graminicola]